ncbi:SDR family oxidoreductase [Yinghuangia aomiensis]
MPKYTGRNAVVVGGTTGVGLAIAKRLVEGGARVLVTADGAHGFAEAAGRLGSAASLVACDLSGADAANASDAAVALAAEAQRVFGTVDMLFVGAEPPTAQGALDGCASTAKGAYLAAQALAPLLADDGAVVFTTIAADACRPGMPDAGVHAMTASAVHAFARVLAVELADRGVRVNAVAPGAIDMPLARNLRSGTAPLGRRGSVDDVARAALFLAADATFTTGTVLAVDGGLGSDSRQSLRH